MTSAPAVGEEHLLPMTVDDIGFLLEKLGQDCHPLQFLRELTQNSIEAIKRTGKPGGIVWDVDWTTFDLTGHYKLSLVDAGDGMTGDQMTKLINQLSSSLSEQSFSGNYGVGAKIAAATRNHYGVIYCSWKENQGAMIHLHKSPKTGQYGLKQWERSDGAYEYHLPIDDDVKPAIIGNHGTMVVLLGNSEKQSTMTPPEGVAAPSRWIAKYLNGRYFRFPDGVTVKAREGWEYPRSDKDRNLLRQIIGQEKYLKQHAQASGRVKLTNAVAHWWILKDEAAVSNNSGFIESSGHVAALYQDELYELTTARAGMTRLQQFGITFGYRWVVIYIEPIPGPSVRITTNTARTNLLMNNESLPWVDWAVEFREKMPEEIRKHIEEKAAGADSTDHSKAIRDRLKDLLHLYRISRYKPVESGKVLFDDERIIRAGPTNDSQVERAGGGGGGGGLPREKKGSTTHEKDGKLGNIYSIFEKKDGAPGRRVKSDPFPVVNWVTIKNGSREYGDIEDRAAKYLSDQNKLLINQDFRGFDDMVTHFGDIFGKEPGVLALIEEACKAWFEQALVETVMGIQALRNSKEWSPEDILHALSEESLTAAVMQRYHVVFAVKRQLGSKLSQKAGPNK